MFEPRTAPLLPRSQFLRRVLRSAGIVAAVVALALGIGLVGYHEIAGLSWIDAFLNAAMILSGMGPVNELTTDAAKLFAAGYALFSGVVFVTSIGVAAAPLVHRLLHRFHLEEDTPSDRR